MEDATRPESFVETPGVSHLDNGRYAFGPFVIDPVKRTLCCQDRSVPITAKTFDVLLVLLEHRDRVVAKDELLSLVWPTTTVQENNLVRQISSLRRALGQRPDQHDYIVTIPGSGYRFVGDVKAIAEGREEQRHTDDVPASQRATPLPRTTGVLGELPRQRSGTLLAAGVITCGLVLTALAITVFRPSAEARPEALRYE